MTKTTKLLVLATLAALASGCAGPRIVRSMNTTRDGKFRLIYDRNAGWAPSSKASSTARRPTPAPSADCQPVKVTFVEEG